MSKIKWDGKGKPIIGCECLGQFVDPDNYKIDYKGKVLIKGYFRDKVWFECDFGDTVVPLNSCHFEPLVTLEEAEREKAIKEMCDLASSEGAVNEQQIGTLYDAGCRRYGEIIEYDELLHMWSVSNLKDLNSYIKDNFVITSKQHD